VRARRRCRRRAGRATGDDAELAARGTGRCGGIAKAMTAFGVLNVAVATLLFMSLAGCDIVPGRARAQRNTPPAQTAAFYGLYDRQCAGCHGRDGRLGAARPLNDPVYLALVPAERVRHVIAEGVSGTAQPAFALSAGGALTDEQIDSLVQGLQASWSRPDALQGA